MFALRNYQLEAQKLDVLKHLYIMLNYFVSV